MRRLAHHWIELRNRLLKAVLVIGLFVALAALLTQPINLTAVDIGRHIKNGELILAGHTELLYKNYYSFTHPDYPFINHHWFFGVLSFLWWKWVGFNGLSIAYILVLLAAFLLFYKTARRYAGVEFALFSSAVALTVIADRREIRPEGISFLLMGVYFYLLHLFKARTLSSRWLLGILVSVQLVWVNTHVFFFMGPVLVAVFWWEAILAKEDKAYCMVLKKLLMATVMLNVLNPSLLGGMFVPLNIFKRFGYMLAENQNIFFMIKRFPHEDAYYWFLVVSVLTSLMAVWAVKRDGIKKQLPFMVLMLFVMAAGFKAVRLTPFFAAFSIPLGARFMGAESIMRSRWVRGLLMISVVVLIIWQLRASEHRTYEIGLIPAVNGSAEFFKGVGLKGPIFSNYDIGGYLIFHLAGQERMFVDNRQEAYPVGFLQDIYVAMQENPKVWQEMQDKYGFNVIYFYRHDMTPWGQKFLVDRISDPQWAPIFVDAYTIIFARRNSINQAAINRFELPKSMFAVSHNN